jgi:hypothetical protein
MSLGGKGKQFKCLLSTCLKIDRLHSSLRDMEQTFGNVYSSMTRVFSEGSMFLRTAIDEAQLDSEGYMLKSKLKSFENM